MILLIYFSSQTRGGSFELVNVSIITLYLSCSLLDSLTRGGIFALLNCFDDLRWQHIPLRLLYALVYVTLVTSQCVNVLERKKNLCSEIIIVSKMLCWAKIHTERELKNLGPLSPQKIGFLLILISISSI